MNAEDSYDLSVHKVWASVTAFVVMLVIALIFALVHDYQLTERAAVNAGLVEKPNVNAAGYHWDKP